MKWLTVYFILTLLPAILVPAPIISAESALSHPSQTENKEIPHAPSCLTCHQLVKIDQPHAFSCADCHKGNIQETQHDKAHTGLIVQPSQPMHASNPCASCHPRQTEQASRSSHYTQANKINTIRSHFSSRARINTPLALPKPSAPFTSPFELVDDMLRRRCLRCHVYTKGDAYDATGHGTGCAACHLSFAQSSLLDHRFIKPADSQCLSCHYSNHVGSDYYGRYEHDYNWEYRTPYSIKGYPPRPFGVETHDLAPDIHQQRGMGCLDCHREIGHSGQAVPRCAACHAWKPGMPIPSQDNLSVRDGVLVVSSSTSGKPHAVPPMRHEAHQRYGATVACQVCHGQWSFNDSTTHLLLAMGDEVEEAWERLTVQSSSEVEQTLERHFSATSSDSPTMRDGLTGEPRPGIWLQGFGQRRWEQMIIRKDTDGQIKVFRPILDLRLSMTAPDGQVLFDNIKGQDDGLRPYTPHTTGPAGQFYLDRFQHLLTP